MNLQQWRTKSKLSMAEAAIQLGVSQPTVSRIERGVHLPSSGTIAKLSEKTDGAITGPDLYKFWEASQQPVTQ
jgi:transcriptional regulator with XRE-family HTH domain